MKIEKYEEQEMQFLSRKWKGFRKMKNFEAATIKIFTVVIDSVTL